MPPPSSFAPGHVTIAPRRHVPCFYDLDVQEQRAVWNLVGSIKGEIERSLRITNFRVGFADAEPGTQGHAMVHVVPVAPGVILDLPHGIEWISEDLA